MRRRSNGNIGNLSANSNADADLRFFNFITFGNNHGDFIVTVFGFGTDSEFITVSGYKRATYRYPPIL